LFVGFRGTRSRKGRRFFGKTAQPAFPHFRSESYAQGPRNHPEGGSGIGQYRGQINGNGSPAEKRNLSSSPAHIDHVGIGETSQRRQDLQRSDGTTAAETAAVLDIAASLKRHPEKLRRSILFVLVTAEGKKGLLGSKIFRRAIPRWTRKVIVADINIDMFSAHRAPESPAGAGHQ